VAGYSHDDTGKDASIGNSRSQFAAASDSDEIWTRCQKNPNDGGGKVVALDNSRSPWTKDQITNLKVVMRTHDEESWSTIASHVPGKSREQCARKWSYMCSAFSKVRPGPLDMAVLSANGVTKMALLLSTTMVPTTAAESPWPLTSLNRIRRDVLSTTMSPTTAAENPWLLTSLNRIRREVCGSEKDTMTPTTLLTTELSLMRCRNEKA
jgi:hypothetical protein